PWEKYTFPCSLLQLYRNRISDGHGIRRYHTIHGPDVNTTGSSFFQSGGKIRVCLPIGAKALHVRHLHHKEHMSLKSLLPAPAKLPKMFGAPLSRRVRKPYHSVFLQCHAFYFDKVPLFPALC